MRALLLSRLGLLALVGLGVISCGGSTGSDLFTFGAAAAGPADADPSKPFAFDTDRGYRVVLTRAKLAIGAVYLNHALPISGAQATSCILPGIYVAQVTQPLLVDLLSPTPQAFPAMGESTQNAAIAAEVWLTSGVVAGQLETGDVNALESDGVVLDLAGTAEGKGKSYPFAAMLTIGKNRTKPIEDPSQPSAAPVCKERIVSPIPINLETRSGGNLLVRVDPRGLFGNVEFSALDETQTDPPLYQFQDETVGQPNINLYQNLHARSGVYTFLWQD